MSGQSERTSNNGKKSRHYGNPIVGVWYCEECGYQCFPRHLRETEAVPPFLCPECRSELYYDEEE